MRTHALKQNDRRPTLQVALLTAARARTNLTTAHAVEFTMVTSDRGTTKIDGAAAVVTDAAEGEVQYAWADGDTDAPGEYLGWFTVFWDEDDLSDKESFPGLEEEYIPVYITRGNPT